MSKKLEDMTFIELVDYATMQIHMGLLRGEFREMVYFWMSQTLHWSDKQQEK